LSYCMLHRGIYTYGMSDSHRVTGDSAQDHVCLCLAATSARGPLLGHSNVTCMSHVYLHVSPLMRSPVTWLASKRRLVQASMT